MKFQPPRRPVRPPPRAPRRQGNALHLVLLLTILVVASPVLQFLRQRASGHPLDPGYFQSELSPQKLLNLGLYNGDGGADWRIGEPLTTLKAADRLRSLPELRGFALDLVNRDRAMNGLAPLLPNTDLDLAAQLHAQDMHDRDYFSHVSPEGQSPLDRYLTIAQELRGIGENIAFQENRVLPANLSERQLEDLQRGWMYSNGHRANLLAADFTQFGFAIVAGEGRLYAVQLFGY